MADDKNTQQQPQLQDGETFVPRQKPAASTPAPAAVAAPQPTTNHPALNTGETFHPRSTPAPVAAPVEDTDKTWGSVAGIPYKKQSWTHIGSQALEGLSDMGSSLYHMGKDVVTNPNWVESGNGRGTFKGYITMPSTPTANESTLDKFVTIPMQQQAEKAGQEWQKGNHIAAAGHELAASIPGIGPWAASLGEQAGTGDVSGAAAKGGTQALAAYAVPKIVSKGAGIIAKTPSTVGNIYRGVKYLGDVGNELKNTHENITGAVKNAVETPTPSPAETAEHLSQPEWNKANSTINGDALGQSLRDQLAKPTIPQPGEVPAPKAPSVRDLANQVVEQNLPNAKPLKPNVPLREQMPNAPKPGTLEWAKAQPPSGVTEVQPANAKPVPQPEIDAAANKTIQDYIREGRISDYNQKYAKTPEGSTINATRATYHPEIDLTDEVNQLGKPNITMAEPDVSGLSPEDQNFSKHFPDYPHVRAQAEWETGNPEGVQNPAQRAEVTKEWNKPEPAPRTSAHHVYGDEVGEELRSKPDLQQYFNGKKGEGFTNVKARQALINAGEDMGQQVVNSKQLQGEGAITPGKAVELLRSKGYTMEQIRDLAEKHPTAREK